MAGGAVAGIQARMSSTRLPGKSLADLAGKPLVQRVWERVSAAREVERAFVLTSAEPSDDPLAEFLESAGIPFRRGSLEDVLGRYLDLLDELEPRHVVRVTGDCPLVAPEFVDLQLEALRAFDADRCLLEGGRTSSVLEGQGAWSARALRMAGESSDPLDREHVGSFFLARSAARLRTVALRVGDAYLRDGFRLTVDEADDLACLRAVFEAHAEEWGSLVPLTDAVAWLEANPDVRASNQAVRESAANASVQELVRERSRTNAPVGTWCGLGGTPETA